MQLNMRIPFSFGNLPKNVVPGPPLPTSNRTASSLFRLKKVVYRAVNKNQKEIHNFSVLTKNLRIIFYID